MARRHSSWGRRAGSVALWALAAGHVVEALVLRRRRAALEAMPTAGPGADTGAGAAQGSTEVPAEPAVVMRQGVDLDGATSRAAAAEMARAGAEVMDLVPGDLPVERALRLLRRVDPERLPEDPMYAPGGAHEALVVHPSAAHRMGLVGSKVADERGGLLRTTVRAQRYAPTTAVVRVAPGLAAGPAGAEDRWRELEESTAAARNYVSLPPLLVGAETAHLLAMSAGFLVAPVAAGAALATWSLQPQLVFAGRGGAGSERAGLRPRDLGGASVMRLAGRWAGNVRAVAAGYRHTRAAAAARAAAPGPVLPSRDELFESRRVSCSWCGSGELVGRLDTTDLLQSKPGGFHLDECTACGHIFQNPALSIAGLDHYYRDFYDGPGEEQWETLFAASSADNRDRVRTMTDIVEPRAWLDVGTGHGHFCLVARHELPGVVFDGLDMGESVEEAARRGWVDTAHRGLFPELADGLPRSYDVVSMHHYLEHTRDPRQEIAAAAKVLEPGGHLMIEVPDPESPWSRRLGRYWLSWLQPQHQHFVSCANLTAALEDVGFEVVSVQRGSVNLGGDASLAVLLAVEGLARSPHAPWLPPASMAHRAKRAGLIVAAIPALAVAGLVDLVKDARLDPDAPGNAYRVVARRV